MYNRPVEAHEEPVGGAVVTTGTPFVVRLVRVIPLLTFIIVPLTVIELLLKHIEVQLKFTLLPFNFNEARSVRHEFIIVPSKRILPCSLNILPLALMNTGPQT